MTEELYKKVGEEFTPLSDDEILAYGKTIADIKAAVGVDDPDDSLHKVASYTATIREEPPEEGAEPVTRYEIRTVKAILSAEEIQDHYQRIKDASAQAPERLKAEILNSTQGMLDAFAATRLYDGILSACTYANSTNPKFAAEGAYCVELRDQTWAKLYEMLTEVEAGTRAIPASFADIAPELPVSSAKWPA